MKATAVLGTRNNEGVSIFNCEVNNNFPHKTIIINDFFFHKRTVLHLQVATKQLLFRLLDFLGQEPKWGEGDCCEECGAKFGLTTRKHHW